MTRGKAFSFEGPPDPPEGGDVQPPEPFIFSVQGEDIECRAEVDGLRLLEYTAGMGWDQPVSTRARTMYTWLTYVMGSNYETFAKVVEKHNIDLAQVSDISRYLAEVYTDGRPTEPADSSSDGRQTDGSSSADSSSSEESTTAA